MCLNTVLIQTIVVMIFFIPLYVHKLNSTSSFSCSLPPVKHVKYGALGRLIGFELTVCWLTDENISQASKTLSYFCKVDTILMECSTCHMAMIQGIRDCKWRGKFVLYTEWNSEKVARLELLKCWTSESVSVCLCAPLCAFMCYLRCSMQLLLWQQWDSQHNNSTTDVVVLCHGPETYSGDLCSTNRSALFVSYVCLPQKRENSCLWVSGKWDRGRVGLLWLSK